MTTDTRRIRVSSSISSAALARYRNLAGRVLEAESDSFTLNGACLVRLGGQRYFLYDDEYEIISPLEQLAEQAE